MFLCARESLTVTSRLSQGESVSNATEPNRTAWQLPLADKLSQSRWHGCRAEPGCVGGSTGHASVTIRLGLATWSGPRQLRPQASLCPASLAGALSASASQCQWAEHQWRLEHQLENIHWRANIQIHEVLLLCFYSFAREMKFPESKDISTWFHVWIHKSEPIPRLIR